MFRINEIRPTKESKLFLEELKELLYKHKVTMVHHSSHIHFNRDGANSFAQCCCVNGISKIGD